MADNNVSFHQRAVIEFLVKDEISAANIHHRLQRMYRDLCMGVCSVGQCVKHFKDGNTSIQDQSRSGHPRTASTEPNKKRVDEIIKEERHVTLDETATKLGVGHNAVQEMIGSLDYRKICACRVPRLLTEDHKVSEKPSLQKCFGDIEMTEMIFYSVFRPAMKVGCTISTLKRSGRVWNGIIWIHQQKRNQRQCH